MAKGKKRVESPPAERPKRVKVTAEEALKRMADFPKRKDQFIASVPKGKDRGVLPDEPISITPEYGDAKERPLPAGGQS
jgi:hypothetical protein